LKAPSFLLYNGVIMPTIITVQNLRKTYGKTVAVEDISFEIAEGEIFGFLGPNGAGKTTTVECLQALRTPDSGEIKILGLDPIKQAREVRQLTGSQLQESALPDRIKVWEALDLFASVTPHALDWHVLLEQWGLAEKCKAGFHSLSGGQRQRLFIALALVNNPKVVFLDEMTTGLDPAARRVAWDLIRAIREKGATVVLVTHFMDEAENLCDRLAVVDHGRIIASDSPSGLISRYAGKMRVIFSSDKTDFAWLKQVPGVTNVVADRGKVEVAGTGPVLALVAAALVQHGIVPSDLRAEQANLEDVFLKLTGHAAGE
jgi:ABC-2 type transport system ATP-binding protein